MTELEIARFKGPGHIEEEHAAIAAGKALQGYLADEDQAPESAAHWANELGLPTDAYLNYRNGDWILMMVPHGTPTERLPNRALDYGTVWRWQPVGPPFEWVDKETGEKRPRR